MSTWRDTSRGNTQPDPTPGLQENRKVTPRNAECRPGATHRHDATQHHLPARIPGLRPRAGHGFSMATWWVSYPAMLRNVVMLAVVLRNWRNVGLLWSGGSRESTRMHIARSASPSVEDLRCLRKQATSTIAPKRLAERCRGVLLSAQGQAPRADRGGLGHHPAKGLAVARSLCRVRSGGLGKRCAGTWAQASLWCANAGR